MMALCRWQTLSSIGICHLGIDTWIVYACTYIMLHRSVHFDDQDHDESELMSGRRRERGGEGGLSDLALARATVAATVAAAGHDSSASPGFFHSSPSVLEKGSGAHDGDTSSWLRLLSLSDTLRIQNHSFSTPSPAHKQRGEGREGKLHKQHRQGGTERETERETKSESSIPSRPRGFGLCSQWWR